MKQVEIRTVTMEFYDEIIELWKRAGLPFKPKGRESKQMIEQQMKAFPEFHSFTFLIIGLFMSTVTVLWRLLKQLHKHQG